VRRGRDPEKAREAREALKARAAAQKERLKARQAELREGLKQGGGRPGAAAVENRRLRRLLLAMSALLLLLLVRDCRRDEPTPCPEPEVCEPAEGETAEPDEPAAALPGGRVDRQDRPEYASATPEALPWIRAFRMQVAARGPRLAGCFVGVGRPGALKWTTSVEPSQGRVSDHLLEPTSMSEGLTREQQDCAVGVLSDPLYTLEADGERATPSRVSMLIEF